MNARTAYNPMHRTAAYSAGKSAAERAVESGRCGFNSDLYWSILKSVEQSQMQHLCLQDEQAAEQAKAEEQAAEAAARAEDGSADADDVWASWTAGEAGMDRDRWSRAHLLINGETETACGASPKWGFDSVRWGAECDSDADRCKRCERKAAQQR